MSQSKFGPAAFSQGDIMHRLRDIERQLRQLQTARGLEAALIGAGGLRILGGLLRIQDTSGDDMFRAGGDPGEVFIREDIIGPLVDSVVQELLTSPAGQDLAAFVLASRIKSATATGSQTTTSTSYVSLSGGPDLTDVPVSESGTMLVMVGCRGNVSSAIGQPDQGAAMSFQISGESSVAPDDDNAYTIGFTDLDEVSFVHTRSMAAAQITGLNPGMHNVSARYRRLFGGGAVDFQQRTIVAIGL